MRRQNLLDQGRARARQTYDEDGGGALAAEGLAGLEEFARAQGNLTAGEVFEHFGTMALGGFFQRVAALVVFERFGEKSAVFQSLAQRETQVISVFGRRGGARLTLVHECDLGVRKTVGFEIRQSPECFAEAGFRCCGVVIGVDRLLSLARRLQGIANRQVELRILWRLFQQLAIERQSPVVVADPGHCGSKERSIGVIGRGDRHELRNLHAGLLMLLPLEQYECKLVTCGFVAGGWHECPPQKQFGVEFGSGVRGDFCQQAQGLNVLAVEGDVLPDQVLGAADLAIVEPAAG